MKAIVTGSTGMIGIHLINKLLNEKFYVYAVVRQGSKKISRLRKNNNLTIIECDLNNIGYLSKHINEKCDIFYHLAWDGTFGNDRNQLYSQIENIKYSVDAVNVAYELGCKTFVGAGSQAEFGRFEGLLNMSIPCFPENGYGIAKLCAGQMTRLECYKYGIKHIWTRILSVYGPYDNPNTLISSAINTLNKGDKINCTKGEQIWDYLYVKDCANALYLLGKNGIDGKVYCIGSGKGEPLYKYLDILHKNIGNKGIINFGAIPYSNKQVMHLVADISNLKEDTGFIPSYSFEEGIKETIEFMRRGDSIEN